MGFLDSILDFFSKSSDLNQYPSQYQPTIREAEKSVLPEGVSGLGFPNGPDAYKAFSGQSGSFFPPVSGIGGSFQESNPGGPNYSNSISFDAENGTPTFENDKDFEKAKNLYGSALGAAIPLNDAMTPWSALGSPSQAFLDVISSTPTSLPDLTNKVDNSDIKRLMNNALFYDDIYPRYSGTPIQAGNAPNSQPEVSYDDVFSRDGGTPVQAGNAPNSQPEVPNIYERGYENKDFDINAPKESSANPAEGATEQGTSDQTQQPDKSYNSHAVTTEMDEFYETLKNNPELAEKYAEYLDEDNYGYSRARASQNSDLFADLALADPRIMQRFKNSGVDVEDLENLSNNIYKYMWEDNLIDLYDYYDNKSGYLGDSDKSVIDMLGFLMQDSNYNFDSDFIRRYDLNPEDAMVQALIRNAYAGGAREYDLGRITDLMRRSGYLADDEELTWGDASNSWWVDNDKNRANLPEYVSLRDTQYLDPQKGVYDTNAALSLADAMAIADSQLLDANGKAPSRRVVVSSKNPQKNKQKAFNSAVLDASTAGTGLGYY